MTLSTAIKKARDGEFEFMYDIKKGNNEVRYQTPSGKWKEKIIEITNKGKPIEIEVVYLGMDRNTHRIILKFNKNPSDTEIKKKINAISSTKVDLIESVNYK